MKNTKRKSTKKRMNLVRRGVILPSSICPLCNQAEEMVHHLFVECKIAYQVWSMVSKWAGIQMVYNYDLIYHLLRFLLPHFN